jgi:hypothetical protein
MPAGKDVKLPTELKTYAVHILGCPAWSIYLSLIWPPTGIVMLFTGVTNISISPDGTLRLLAPLRTVMSFNFYEDIATIALIDGAAARGGCCGSCYSHVIEFTFTDAGFRRIAQSSCCGCCVDEKLVRAKFEMRPMGFGGAGTLQLASDLGLADAEVPAA